GCQIGRYRGADTPSGERCTLGDDGTYRLAWTVGLGTATRCVVSPSCHRQKLVSAWGRLGKLAAWEMKGPKLPNRSPEAHCIIARDGVEMFALQAAQDDVSFPLFL